MKIRCPNCQTIRELPHEEKFSCSFECSCGHTFPADDETVLEEYSEIDLSLPEKIGGYPIEGLIGLGGMGKVCKGLHKELHVPVAVKLLRKELTREPSAREKFLATGQLCAQMDSPHIVKIYDCGMEEENPYLVMEYLGGGTALDHLENNGPFTPEMCAETALEVCQGLEKAESSGLVHRDLKPDNIMFASDNSVRIMDLGLAFLREENSGKNETADRIRQTALVTSPAPVIGTAHYMPPEQILDPSSCDSRSDLYALGVTMYQLVTGVLPFDDPSHAKVREMQLNDIPKPPSHWRKDLPSALEKIILRAMEKDPSSRYENAKSMMADLEAFLRHRVLPSSFRIVSGEGSSPEKTVLPPPVFPRWQEKIIFLIQEKCSPSFRERHKELWHYLSTTPQLHLLRLLVELVIVIALAVASAFFWH